jgi:hypothetical protein
VRSALHALTGQSTIPQVLLGGQWLGGCVDTLEAWRDGRLPDRLRVLGPVFDADGAPDPDAMLPAWLQPRRATWDGFAFRLQGSVAIGPRPKAELRIPGLIGRGPSPTGQSLMRLQLA